MSLDKNVVMNTIYNAGLITLGAVGTSMVSRKLMKDGLGVADKSTQGVLKLAVAVGGGSILVKYLYIRRNLGKRSEAKRPKGRPVVRI